MMFSLFAGKKMKAVFLSLLIIGMLVSCGEKDSSEQSGTTNNMTGKTGGLTSIEAMELAYADASKQFDDAVLFRMAPIDDKDSTVISLDPEWKKNDRAYNWFIWYADANGENWMMYNIIGKKLEHKDIGTRSFSVMKMGNDWPRKSTEVSMQQAAVSIEKEGADLDYLEWVEFSCDYPLGNFKGKPLWAFSISQPLDEGMTYNYRIFVNAVTGEVLGAVNNLNDSITVPIDLEELQKEHEDTHEADLRIFLENIGKGDINQAVGQLHSQLAPDQASSEMWASNFKSIQSLKVVSIEQSSVADWTKEAEYYKVTMEIKTNETPDKYGWENGENIRWFMIAPQGAGYWKIVSVSSSP
ncbi:MAG: hypothetical protein JXQ23_07960 [Clostridia bacterium]|nr:hypothetical protein [Clostridia bacterium]